MTEGALAQRLAALNPQQRAELVRTLRERAAQSTHQPIPHLPRSEPAVFCASFEQRRVWFLDRFDPGTAAHNMPFAVSLDGELDLAALQRALDALVVRHEALRTTFLDVDGSPSQLVGRPYPVALSVVDLTGEPADQRDSIAHEVIEQEAGRGFDLDTGPLWRALLVRLAPQRAILQLTVHHSVCDGWSTGVLLRDLVAGYREAPNPPPPIQYPDYAVWQAEHVSGDRLAGLVEHWREQLAGTPPLNLPTDRPRPAVRRYRGALDTSPLGASLGAQLRDFSQRHQVTPFVTLLAALEVLLARYCGQDDFAVGTVLAGRDRPELAEVVGFVARTVALRADIAGPEPFRDLLRRVHERVLVAHEHSQLPFEKLVDELKLPRDPSRPPLFSVLLVLQNTPKTAVDLPGLALRALEPDSRAAQFDLSLYLTDTSLSIEYDTDLFDVTTVRRFASHFRTLLAAAMSEPDSSIRRLPLLSDAESHQQLHTWNDTAATYPDASLGELVARQAAVQPHAVAIRSAETGESLTYLQLDRRANQISRWLLARGAEAGVLIGVGAARGPHLVAALLGVVRTGAAYVPLDPDYPAARLEQMAQDAALRHLVADRSTIDRLPAAGIDHVLLLDTDSGLGQESEAAVPGVVNARQVAYTIFTSGSTGRPKGVAVSHRALINLLASVRHRCGMDAGTVLLAVTSLSFDIAGLELYAPLLAGGQVVLCDRDTASGADTLRAALDRVNPTIMQATPATWQLLLDGGWPGAPGLTALCGGEALPVELAGKLAGRVGQLWNMYGPTETTIWSGALRLDGGDVTIGGPLANTRIYLLDALDQPVPPGVAGQVHIAGDGLADGYLNAAALTAQRFVPDPYGVEPGARMYRTGDAARWRPDGRMDFLGRLDHQVKVRGHRIELGDIEAALNTAGGVARAVVTTFAADGGQAQLAAYVQPVPGATPTVTALREHLAGLLPGYMIPARFAVLEAFPLTPNGKVDRKALPSPESAALDSGTAYQTPVGEVETTLAGVWAELLNLERVGRDDNFFTIGGDSLIAVRMVARAGQLGVQLTTKQVFLHQQLHQLAAAAGTVRLVAEQGEVTGSGPLPIATHQFYDGVNPKPDYHSLAFQFAARERLDPELLDQVLDELVRQHDALRVRLLPPDSGQLGGRLHIDEYRRRRIVEEVDLSGLDEAEQALRLEEWTDIVETGFHAEQGNLFRAVLLDVGSDRPQHLLLAAHYLVADVVSWHILVADLDVLYRRRSRQEPYQLPAKTTSLPQWVGRLAGEAAGAEVTAEIPLWTDSARGRSAPIPVDRPGGDNRVAANDAAFLILTVEETRDLQERVIRRAKLPMDAVLLAGIGHALTERTGAEVLPVDIYVPGRDSPFPDMDLSRTVGWLTYRYPMWLDVRREGALPHRVTTIGRQLAAIPRGGLGYGALRYYRGDPAIAQALAAQPVPDVLFNFFGAAPGGFQVLRPLAGTSGHYHDTESERMRLLMINGAVFRGQLRLEWEYSSGRHDTATIEAFIASCRQFLLDLIDACPPAGG